MKADEADAKKTDAMTKTRVESHEEQRTQADLRYNLADTIPTITIPHPVTATC